MWWALFWGAVAGAALLIGAVVGITLKPSPRLVGAVMAFGAGVLISALAFSLTRDAFDLGGILAVTTGMALGALAYFGGNVLLGRHRMHGARRHNTQVAASVAGHTDGSTTGSGPSTGSALAFGAVLDGVPESAAIGITLIGGGVVGLPIVAAVFLSNIPEGWSSAASMRKDGRSVRYILLLWATVMACSAIASLLGFVLLSQAPDAVVGTVQAFAAGAIITMLADTMMPEAFERGGPSTGLLTALGFLLSFLLSQV